MKIINSTTPDDGSIPIHNFLELSDTGILWWINKELFHPRGYALCISRDVEKTQAYGWGVEGDGTEPYGFSDEINEEEYAQKLATFLEGVKNRETVTITRIEIEKVAADMKDLAKAAKDDDEGSMGVS